MAAKTTRFFPDEEYRQRREKVQGLMSEQGLDALLIASPENINYLSGLDHMGYFAYQMLILPGKGEPILVTRAMEKATVRDMVPDLVHVGYSDGACVGVAALLAGKVEAHPEQSVVSVITGGNLDVEKAKQLL